MLAFRRSLFIMASSKLMYYMSGLNLGSREDYSEDGITAGISQLPETTVRKLLLEASLKHLDVAQEVLYGVRLANASSPLMQTDLLTSHAARSTAPAGPPAGPTGPCSSSAAHAALCGPTGPAAPAVGRADVLMSDSLRRHSMPAVTPVSSRISSGRSSPNRRSIDIAGELVSTDYFAERAARALQLPSPRRQDVLLSLSTEIRVMIDLENGGDFAMHAIVMSLLPVLGDRQNMDGTAWLEITSFEGPMLKLSHLLQRAIRTCSAEQCRQYIEPLAAQCRHLEQYGVTVFTPVYTALKRKCFYSGSLRA